MYVYVYIYIFQSASQKSISFKSSHYLPALTGVNVHLSSYKLVSPLMKSVLTIMIPRVMKIW